MSIFICRSAKKTIKMGDDWGEPDAPMVPAPEVDDIKLFGRWSTDDVQVSDISLQVSLTS